MFLSIFPYPQNISTVNDKKNLIDKLSKHDIEYIVRTETSAFSRVYTNQYREEVTILDDITGTFSSSAIYV